jgi:hypothetical protein
VCGAPALVERTRGNRQGGTGANFIVVWGAEEPVYEPVVEAVMISAAGTPGFVVAKPGSGS